MTHQAPQNFEDKFWQRVEKTETCWLWKSSKTRDGYGLFQKDGRRQYAHRIAWELYHKTPIPNGMFICHVCDVPSCVRDSHLFLGTHKDNMQDMISKGRNFAITKPERIARGERHRSRTKPESIVKGEAVNTAKLTQQQIDEIRRRYHPKARYGHPGSRAGQLAQEFGVSRSQIWKIVTNKAWKAEID
ncbi:MAG: HNH endonuclease [Calothrix sp. FI2-JRJ7]|jgi:hypothetical protein|nr:HNH endonuclease [Calothrix sp. FI2-JRJ7]